jgi:hypothetical protein
MASGQIEGDASHLLVVLKLKLNISAFFYGIEDATPEDSEANLLLGGTDVCVRLETCFELRHD